MTEQLFHFGRTIRMRCAAESETMGEQPGPIFSGAQVGPFGEAEAPQIFRAFLAMPIMRVAPEPGSQRFLFLCRRCGSDGLLVLFRLRGEQFLKGRISQFTRIPGMVRLNLRITDVGSANRGEQEKGCSQTGAEILNLL